MLEMKGLHKHTYNIYSKHCKSSCTKQKTHLPLEDVLLGKYSIKKKFLRKNKLGD